MMRLSEMKANSKGRITGLGEDLHFLNRITAIGLTEGTSFQVVRNDRKMPVLLYARETLLALNRADCTKIDIDVIG